MEDEKKLTLLELMQELDRYDQALIGFDPEVIGDLSQKASEKIDNIKKVIERCEIAEEWAKEKTKQFAKEALQYRATKTRLNDYILHTMQSTGFQQFAGKKNRVKLTAKKITILDKDKPDFEDRMRYPDLVKVDLSWKKLEIQSELEKGRKIDGASLSESKHVRWYSVREVS